MHATTPTLLLLLFATTASAQIGAELVRNGGFESLDSEPKTYDQLTSSDNWRNVTIGFSEVFSRSAPAKTVGIPDNDYGHQEPQEGDHYAGFFAWKDDMKRSLGPGEDAFVKGWNAYSEYLIGELVHPLVEGKEYEVSFWIVLSGNSDRAVMGLGAYCGAEPLKFDHRRFLERKPQVSVDAIVEEKGQWVQVKGTFVADGDEIHITIGTFPAAGFDSKKLVEGPDNQYAYYYVDNISLREVVPPPATGEQ
jgi:OmpA-OmpF porin, OOP family